MKAFSLLLLLCLVATVVARSVVYDRSAPPKGWTLVGRTAPDQITSFKIALYQQNVDQLLHKVETVSDPKNDDYGNFWTREEVLSLIAPSEEDRSQVLNWLHSEANEGDILKIRDYVDAFQITAKVEYVERLFSTQLHSFVHEQSKKYIIRQMGEYSVPEDVRQKIHLIAGIDEFPPIKKTQTVHEQPEGALNGCNVPYTMKQLYNIPYNLTVTNPAAVQAPYSQVAGGEEGFGSKSLIKWLEYNNYPVNLSPVDCLLGDEGSAYFNASDDGEATLDIQMLTTFGLGAKTCFWLMHGWMYDFSMELFNTTGAPLVNSISYGWNEWQQCDASILQENCKKEGIPNSQVYVQRTEIEWAKIASLGITVLAASGDQGAPGDANIECTSKAHPINPLYPGASAFITSVGATNLRPPRNTSSVASSSDLPPICHLSECVCSTATEEVPAMLYRNQCIFTTGGGFSEYIPQPSWQKTVVNAYLASNATRPASNLFNSTNRGFPDISALGWFIETIYGGRPQLSGGTSASTPIIGGMLTQINNWRLNNNLPPLGFFNPLLYQIYAEHPEYFHDVTIGGNACTEYSCCAGLGYHATQGWDPVSGVGTPNFGAILSYIQNMNYPNKLKNLP